MNSLTTRGGRRIARAALLLAAWSAAPAVAFAGAVVTDGSLGSAKALAGPTRRLILREIGEA